MVGDSSGTDLWLEELTQRACESAKKGHWDEVIAYYAQRTQCGMLGQVSPSSAKKLVEWDQWMLRRIKEIHGALQQQILEIQAQRRKLASVKRRYGNVPSGEYSHHLQTI